MRRYFLTLDLKDDPALIAAYEQHHAHIWPEIRKSILLSGITCMEIYRFDTRLCMMMETDDSFSFEKKAEMDAVDQKVQEWEALMLNYQAPLSNAPAGRKWILMDKIFEL